MFTNEVENDGILAFPDIRVFRESGKFLTSIHRKATFSGIYSNFNSYIPEEYKSGLIRTLLFRSFSLVSNEELFHKEVEKLKETLHKNAYPTKFVGKCIRIFSRKIHEEKKTYTTVPRKEINLVLPFLGSMSLSIRSKLFKYLAKQCLLANSR